MNMELLPSKKLLEEIGFEENDFSYLVRLFSPEKKFKDPLAFSENFFQTSEDPDFMSSYFDGYLETVRNYYRNIFQKDDSKFKNFCRKLYADSEALNNAHRHNKRNSNFFYQVIFGKKGICSGLNNEADYFKNAEIKRLYESKILPEKYNAGTEIIYINSDKIEVDTNKGVLYLVHFLPN